MSDRWSLFAAAAAADELYVLSSDVGTVLKVVMIPRESWHDLEEVVLEEMTVFRVRKEKKKKTHKTRHL